MMNRTRGKTFLLALGLAAALGAAAQARDDARPLDSTALRATVDGGAEMWPFEIYMDGAAYTWRIHFPSDVQYDGYLVAIREGSGPWNILDAKGRIRLDSPSEGLLNALSSSAGFKQYPSEASPLEQGMPEDSAYYFPGWQAKEFQLARAPSNGHEAFTPLTTERMIEQVLPSPALLNPQGPVTAYVALKRKGSTTVDGLVITTEAEYVTGERAFFSKAAYAGKSYVQKASALMASTFQAGNGLEVYEQAVLESNPGLSMSAADWTLFAADSDLATMQHRLLTHFLNTMLGAAQNVDDIKVFEGADRPSFFETLYGVNRIPYVASYLRYIYDARQPLYVASMEESYPNYDYSQYLPLSQTEGAELAKAALRYATWGTDYALPAKGPSVPVMGPPVYLTNKGMMATWTASANGASSLDDYAPGTTALDVTTVAGSAGLPSGWAAGLGADSPYAGGTAGSPLPYSRGGIDGPRTFAMAMVGAYGSARKPGYALPPSGVGVDGMGLVTGAIAMTSYANAVVALDSSTPAQSLDGYYRSGTKPSGVARFTRSDLEKISIVVPDLSAIQVGDLVVHYGEGEGKYGDALELGVVVSAPILRRPVPGQDASGYLKTVVVVGASQEKGQVSLATWLSNGQNSGFSEGGDNFHLRRLLRVPATTGLAPQGNLVTKASLELPGARALKVDRSKASSPAYAVTVDYFSIDLAAQIGEKNLERMMNQDRAIRGNAVIQKTFYQPAIGERVGNYVDPRIDSMSFTYERSYDSSSNPGVAGDRQRWIPNTGQYLVLENLHVTARNGDQASIDLGLALGSDYIAYVGASDRNYYMTPDPGGNICVNAGPGFELAAMPEAGFENAVGIPIATFKKGVGDSYDVDYAKPTVYAGSSGYQGGNRIVIDQGQLKLKAADGKTYDTFGIRPIASNIRPGDDFLLEVRLTKPGTGKEIKTQVMADKDYLAVYDKKMLWRANLYIDEGDAEYGGVDWNDAFPWNAPPSGLTKVHPKQGKVKDSGLPLAEASSESRWWGPEWGYNDWNRFDLRSMKEAKDSLVDLPIGDGGQVLEILSYTQPLSYKGNTNAVCYSYPISYYEPGNTVNAMGNRPLNLPLVTKYLRYDYHPPIDGGTGTFPLFYDGMSNQASKADAIRNAALGLSPGMPQEIIDAYYGGDLPDGSVVDRGWSGSMDSPFDFNKKLRLESSVRRTKSGNDRTVLSWWDYDKTVPDGTLVAISPIHPGDVGNSEIKFDWIDGSPYAPTNLLDGYSDLKSVSTTSFVPGLGLWFQNGKRLGGTDGQKTALYGSWVVEAGTDCLGFAQRSASWMMDSKNGINNAYKWEKSKISWMETTVAAKAKNVWALMLEGGSHRVMPKPTTSSGKAVGAVILEHLDLRVGIAAMDQSILRQICPGDIYLKYSNGTSVNPSHIAIVDSVLYDISGNVSDIRLIEATYDGVSVENVSDRSLLSTLTYNTTIYRLVRLN